MFGTKVNITVYVQYTSEVSPTFLEIIKRSEGARIIRLCVFFLLLL
jgi:hypothetical protein